MVGARYDIMLQIPTRSGFESATLHFCKERYRCIHNVLYVWCDRWCKWMTARWLCRPCTRSWRTPSPSWRRSWTAIQPSGLLFQQIRLIKRYTHPWLPVVWFLVFLHVFYSWSESLILRWLWSNSERWLHNNFFSQYSQYVKILTFNTYSSWWNFINFLGSSMEMEKKRRKYKTSIFWCTMKRR